MLGLEHNVGVILTLNGTVCRYLYNVQLVNLLKLFLFGHGGTRHTGEPFIKTEIVLERNACQRLGLMSNLYALLCLYSLVQTVIEAAAHHKTSGKLVNDDDLAVLDNVVDIVFHYTVSLESLIYMVQQS